VAADIASTTAAPVAAGPSSPPPAIRFASIGRHATLYAIANILSKAVAFFMLPVYTRYLSPAELGTAALIDMTLNVVAIVAGEKIAQGIFRYYHKADSDAERRAVVSTALTTLAVTFSLLGIAIYALAAPISTLVFRSATHGDLVRIAAGSFALQGFVYVPMALCRVQERSGLFLATNVTKLLLAVGFNLVFIVGMGMGIHGVFISTLISNLVLAAWMGTWTVRQVGLGISRGPLRDLVRYGVPLMGVQAASFIITFSDRFFLQASADVSVVGIYNLAYQFGFLLLMLGFVPIDMIWGPKRFQVARSADPSPVLAAAFRLINVVVITLAVGIALFVGDTLRVMAAPVFWPAATVVPVILVAYVFSGWSAMHDIGALVRERTEYLTIANWCAAAAAVISLSLLVPRFHAMGAAMSAVVAFFARWVLTYRFSQRLWPVRYDWRPVLLLCAVALAAGGASALLPDLSFWVSLSARTALFLGYALAIWHLPILTGAERASALATVRRLAGGARA
jgi:O-antigen/teichoic acid export membrane protein